MTLNPCHQFQTGETMTPICAATTCPTHAITYLAGEDQIRQPHLAEVIQYRSLDRDARHNNNASSITIKKPYTYSSAEDPELSI